MLLYRVIGNRVFLLKKILYFEVMRYTIFSICLLLLLNGCTMHPPSASAFMGAAESYKVRTVTVRGETSKYESKDDGWDVPVAVDVLKTDGVGFVWGYGFLPSPYVTWGRVSEYFGFRVWLSAPWAITTLAMLCPVCFTGEEDDESSEDWYESESDDDDDDMDYVEFLGYWAGAFSGGSSIIEQIPIGSVVRIGFEQYIARSLKFFSKDEDTVAEAGFGGYLSLNFKYLSVGLDVHYGFMNFDSNRKRIAASLNVSFHYGREFSSHVK